MTKEELMKEAEEYAKNNAYRYANDFITCQETYFAGAEPREKIITKLEEQNKNQEESLRITLLEEERKANRIKDLEKENAEIKAKEIIRKYYKYNPSCEYSYEDIDKEAEQFLREEEIKENTKAPTVEEIKNRLSNIGEDAAFDYIISLEKENTELSEKLNEQKQYTEFKCSEAVNTIEKLKTFIRKMKRCQNCDKFDYTECKCKVGWCNNFEKWALKEVVFVDLKELDDGL